MHIDRYEQIWIRISVAVLVIFMIGIVVAGWSLSIQVPGVYGRVDPNTVTEPGSPWAEPGLRELAPGKYEAYILAQIWTFVPGEIRVPAGSEVTFYVTSKDVQHGFRIQDTNLSFMVLPGQISKMTHRFEEPGEYVFVCHEYCGVGHHTMAGKLIVEEAVASNQ